MPTAVRTGMQALLYIVLAAGIAACQPAGRNTSEPAADRAAWAGITELQSRDIQIGDGAQAGAGSTVHVHYDGWLYSPSAADRRGRKFDSSREKNRPFRFRIGSGMVIRGWDQGVTGMKVGGRREIVVPAALGYGERGAGGGVIPPGAALVFDIELLAVE